MTRQRISRVSTRNRVFMDNWRRKFQNGFRLMERLRTTTINDEKYINSSVEQHKPVDINHGFDELIEQFEYNVEIDDEEWFMDCLIRESNKSVEETNDDDADKMTRDKKVLLIAKFILNNNITKSGAKQLEKLIRYMSNHFNISADEVQKLIDSVYQTMLKTKYTLCPICYNRVGVCCFTPGCTMKGVRQSKRKTCSYVNNRVFRVTEQIRTIIHESGKDIIEHHHQIHMGNIQKTPHFLKSIETKEQFENNNIILLLSIGYDSFSSTQFSKKSFNNFYGKLVDVPKKLQNSAKLFICGQSSRTKISHHGYSKVGSLISAELSEMEIDGINVMIGGISYRFKIRLYYGCSDFLGIRDAYGLDFWTDPNGCTKCVIYGEKIGRLLRFGGANSFQLKTFAYYKRYGRRKGLHCLMSPADHISDRLHVENEGILKDSLVDITTVSPNWPQRHLTPAQIKLIENGLKSCLDYSYCKVEIIMLSEFRTRTGSEINRLCSIVHPLICATRMIGCKYTRLHLLGIATLQYNMNNPFYNDSNVKLGKMLAIIHAKMCRNFVMKAHFYYIHLPMDIIKYGYEECTTSWVEKNHHEFKKVQPLLVSNTEEYAYKRFVVGLQVNRMLSENEVKFEEKQKETKYQKIVEIPEDVSEYFEYLTYGMNCKIISQIYCNGYYYVPYSTKDASKLKNGYRVFYTSGGSPNCGLIKLIFSTKNGQFAIIEQLQTISGTAMAMDGEIFDSNDILLNRVCNDLQIHLANYKDIIMQVENDVNHTHIECVSLSDFIAPLVEICIEDVIFLIPLKVESD